MKIGVVFFHKNIKNIYKERWINKCIDSILNQTFSNFTIYEINYGNEYHSLFSGLTSHNVKFFSKDLENYAEAMNFIISAAFEDNCDYVFNTNLDDYYHNSRLELQLKMIMEENLDLVSSDFCYVEEYDNNVDNITRFMNIPKTNIKEHLSVKHNVIAHPAVCYSKYFWSDSQNRYDKTKIPAEDLDLWIKSINNGYKFGIHKDVLLFYRIHNKQMSNRKVENIY